jgi:hypothetical protein
MHRYFTTGNAHMLALTLDLQRPSMSRIDSPASATAVCAASSIFPYQYGHALRRYRPDLRLRRRWIPSCWRCSCGTSHRAKNHQRQAVVLDDASDNFPADRHRPRCNSQCPAHHSGAFLEVYQGDIEVAPGLRLAPQVRCGIDCSAAVGLYPRHIGRATGGADDTRGKLVRMAGVAKLDTEFAHF